MAALVLIVACGCGGGDQANALPDARSCRHGGVALARQPTVIVTADFNGDGVVDLATADNRSSNVSVILGNGGGTFANPIELATGGQISALTTGDFNGDGRTDLAVARFANLVGDVAVVGVLFGNGDGTFQPEIDHTLDRAWGLASGDFDRDGNLDLAVLGNGVSIVLGNGDGTFREFGTYAGGSSIAVADLDRDGTADLVVSDFGHLCIFNCGDTPSVPGSLSVLRGRGDGTFAQPLRVEDPEFSGRVGIADVDVDGHLDLVEITLSKLHVLLGIGDGTVRPAIEIGPPVFGTSVAVGDLDGDGWPDVAETSTSTPGESNILSVQHGHGDGTFIDPIDYATGPRPGVVVPVDLDGDSRLDLVVATDPQDAQGGLDILFDDCFRTSR